MNMLLLRQHSTGKREASYDISEQDCFGNRWCFRHRGRYGFRLAEEGAQVIVADRDVERGKSVIARVKDRRGNGFFQEVDLADEDAIERCGMAAAEKVSTLHVLVNNAGVAIYRSIEETKREDWQPQMSTNVRAAL